MAPIFGDKEEEEKEEEGLLSKVFFYVFITTILSLIIGLLIFCKVKIVPRCCGCFQSTVKFVMAKLMFNSILRGAI